MKELLTIEELCEKLKVTRATIYNLMNQGLPYIKVGKVRRFEPDDVLKYFKEGK